jgi:hypothetical protein
MRCQPVKSTLGLGVGLAAVGDRVEVAEDLRDRLDPLPVGAGPREERLGLVDLPGLHRVDELGGLLDEGAGLALDVALVAGRGGLQLGGVRQRLGGLAGDREVLADAVADHAGLARALVRPLGQVDDEVAGQSRPHVLDLAHDAVALGVHIELGDLGARVGDLEGGRPGIELRGRDVARGVGGLDGDGAVARLGLLGAGGEQGQGRDGEAGREEAAVHGGPSVRGPAGPSRRRGGGVQVRTASPMLDPTPFPRATVRGVTSSAVASSGPTSGPTSGPSQDLQVAPPRRDRRRT